MHVNILILIVYTSNYQLNTILYENMRNDFAKSFLVYPKPLNKNPNLSSSQSLSKPHT